MFGGGNQQSAAGPSHQKAETGFSSEQIRQLSELINQAVNNKTLMSETAGSKGDQGEEGIHQIERNMYFTDVSLFIEKLKDIAVSHTPDQ
ncbi:hypothetical protein MMC24_006650, partial [Lignoscripta atroalba]|nr:hypothetical protein [Lignoscripta atroalba]